MWGSTSKIRQQLRTRYFTFPKFCALPNEKSTMRLFWFNQEHTLHISLIYLSLSGSCRFIPTTSSFAFRALLLLWVFIGKNKISIDDLDKKMRVFKNFLSQQEASSIVLLNNRPKMGFKSIKAHTIVTSNKKIGTAPYQFGTYYFSWNKTDKSHKIRVPHQALIKCLWLM